MSIIDSLHPSTGQNDGKTAQSNSHPELHNGTENGDISLKVEREENIDVGPGAFLTQETGSDNNQENDVVTDILKLLYQAASSNIEQELNASQSPKINENDESILEMQHPPTGSRSAIQPLLHSLANGTSQVKSIIHNDISLIYECKRCKGLFRALPNLLRHKKEYCRDTGIFSSFMNRPTNSTEEEDTAFQRVMNALHPPDLSRNTYNVPGSDNAGTQQLPPNVNMPLVPNSYVIPVVTRPPPNMPSSSRNATQGFVQRNIAPAIPNSHFGKPAQVVSFVRTPGSSFTIGPNVPPVPRSLQKKKHICPICKKEMSERKSVRRHLVRIHKLSVMESLKLLHGTSNNATHKHTSRTSPNAARTSPAPTPSVKVISSKELPRVLSATSQVPLATPDRSDKDLHKICIEKLKLGDDRTINVLPSDFKLDTTQCPICPRVLCRKTNVRRHLLEAHNFIIKGDRKYFQIKDLVDNKVTKSPSLRTLRRIKPSDTKSRVDNLPIKSASPGNLARSERKMTIGNPLRTSMPSLSLLRVEVQETLSKTEGIESKTKEAIVDAYGENISSLIDGNAVENVQPMESISNESNNDIQDSEDIIPNEKKSMSSNLDGDDSFSSVKLETADAETTQSDNSKDEEGNKAIKISNFECPVCTKRCARRRTLKNHMFSFHQVSHKEFDSRYKDWEFSTQQDGSVTATPKRQAVSGKRTFDTTGHQSDEPLLKSRKFDPNSFFMNSSASDHIEDPSKSPNHIDMNGSNPTTPVDDITTQKISDSSTASHNIDISSKPLTVIKTSPNVTFNNGADLLQSDEGSNTRRIILRKLGTPSTSTALLSPNAPTGIRPLIKVKLKRTIIASKASDAKAASTNKNINATSPGMIPISPESPIANVVSPKTANTSPRSIRSPTGSGKPNFSIDKLLCFTCGKKFETTKAIKRHLLESHFLPEKDVLASSEFSAVSERIQKAGLELGYDISAAQCVLCRRLYFSREHLARHMTKVHHLSEDDIRYLKYSDESSSSPPQVSSLKTMISKKKASPTTNAAQSKDSEIKQSNSNSKTFSCKKTATNCGSEGKCLHSISEEHRTLTEDLSKSLCGS